MLRAHTFVCDTVAIPNDELHTCDELGSCLIDDVAGCSANTHVNVGCLHESSTFEQSLVASDIRSLTLVSHKHSQSITRQS